MVLRGFMAEETMRRFTGSQLATSHLFSSAITETAESLERLGLAETEILNFHPEIVATNSSYPVVTGKADRAERRVVSARGFSALFRRKAILFTLLVAVSAAGIFYLGPRSGLNSPAPVEREITFTISTLDHSVPAVNDQSTAAGSASLVKNEDVSGAAVRMPGGEKLAFTDSPRFSAPEDFRLHSGSGPRRSVRGDLGLQPAPEGEGRLSARNGTSWQGGWQLDNPAANIKQAESYLRYLNSEFGAGAAESLSVRQTGVLASSVKSIKAPPAKKAPVLRFDR